jgi:hypothetical protein
MLFTFARFRSILLAHKLKLALSFAALTVLVICMLITLPGNKPQKLDTAQTAKSTKTAASKHNDLTGANTTSATDVTTATTQANTATHKPTSTASTSTTTPSSPASGSTPVPTPTPPAHDPCTDIVTGGPITFSAVSMSFAQTITIPVGCTSPSYTATTTDGRTVTFYGFPTADKPAAPFHVYLGQAAPYIGSSATYKIVVSNNATPGYYEDFAYVDDPSLSFGGFAMTLQITIVAR